MVLIFGRCFQGFGESECSWVPSCSFAEIERAHRGRCGLNFGRGRDLIWLRWRAIFCVQQRQLKKFVVAAVARWRWPAFEKWMKELVLAATSAWNSNPLGYSLSWTIWWLDLYQLYRLLELELTFLGDDSHELVGLLFSYPNPTSDNYSEPHWFIRIYFWLYSYLSMEYLLCLLHSSIVSVHLSPFPGFHHF